MTRSHKGTRRALAAVMILALWVAGLGVLVRREYFQPNTERLAEAALRVSPGAAYYQVRGATGTMGFASSTLDTTSAAILSRDYLIADLPLGGALVRTEARTDVTLSRALKLRDFAIAFASGGAVTRLAGHVDGDSAIRVITTHGTRADTQRVHTDGPVLLPTIAPLAIALQETPRVGREFSLPMFDATESQVKNVTFAIRAESLFVVSDSAVFDSTAKRWTPVPDTLRAWRVTSSDASAGFSGWIDTHGRVVETTQLGVVLARVPYEIAWNGWKAVEVPTRNMTAARGDTTHAPRPSAAHR